MDIRDYIHSDVDSGGAGGAPPEFGGSEKGWSLIFAFWSLAITTNTPGFKKLSTALPLIDFNKVATVYYGQLFILLCIYNFG